MKLIDWVNERISCLKEQQNRIIREIDELEKELTSWKQDLDSNIEIVMELEKLLVRLQREETFRIK